jgi:hypothetical protein
MAVPIGNQFNSRRKLTAARRILSPRILFIALLLPVVALPGATQQAWSQGTVQDLPRKADLPDAPQAAGEAQTPSPIASASIHGTVVDRDGATYEGVRIVLTQAAQPLTLQKSTTSDGSGHFEFDDVPPGPFQLTISSTGFATQIVSGQLHPGESYEAIKIVLLVSTATSEVEVTASRFEIAEEELKQEEQQRVFGAIPNFYVVYAPNAPPLNARQKFHLAWRSEIEPFTFLATGISAGIQQGNDDYKGFGQGAQGYAKRYAASYANDFIGNMLGGAVFPSLFKQDPRYFYKGTGTWKSRALYAIANAVICRGDNGHKQFNYSGILGSLASAGISNLYYPAADREGAELTFQNAAIGLGSSAIGNLFQEFLVRKLTPKVPNYGNGNTKP